MSLKKNIEKTRVFEELFRHYFMMVRALLYRLGGSHDLDDRTQEVFLRVWRALDEFKFQASPKTWIYRIAVHAQYDFQRKQKIYLKYLKEYFEGQAQVGISVESKEAEILRQVLSEMPEEKRVPLVLHYFEELSEKEILQVLDIPHGTLKSRIFNAKKDLKRRLLQKGIKSL